MRIFVMGAMSGLLNPTNFAASSSFPEAATSAAAGFFVEVEIGKKQMASGMAGLF
jgi:hypothetical protein